MKSKWANSDTDTDDERERDKRVQKKQRKQKKSQDANPPTAPVEKAEELEIVPPEPVFTLEYSIQDILQSEREFFEQLSMEKSLAPCRSVDSYRKLGRIDEGTYGIVYRAQDLETGAVYALKRLKFDDEQSGFPISSLREVSSLLNDLRHPHIVNVREVVVGSDIKHVFMVMDYAEYDLKVLMNSSEDPFLQAEVKTIMMQLLSAVAHLHDHFFIHRDIKTSNILITRDAVVKLADFGLTRRIGDEPTAEQELTPLVVTLWYRAPELLLGAKVYDHAVDMWSVGCIYGELVKHEAVFQGRTEIDQLKQVIELVGSPSLDNWPTYQDLPHARNFTLMQQPLNHIQREFGPIVRGTGVDLLQRLLQLDPSKRISARDGLSHPLFTERPFPTHPQNLARRIASLTSTTVPHQSETA
eukprot:Partr_v1_DN28966_c1_g1_i2_m25844 putative Cyclin-Dependent Kinase